MRLIIYLTCAVVMFAVSGVRHGKLIDMRSEYQLDSAEYLENAPPLVVLTTSVLGGFRGLIVDALWLRVTHLQQKGDFFEVVQLADWVTKLDPNNSEIWSYHSWNMAYNVSVMMAEPVDRWRWVSNGIKLLRDEGLMYNPGDSEIYREIGWLFQHKIGMTIDKKHEYYKAQWAEEMMRLLGSPHPDLENISDSVREKMIKEYKLDPEIMLELERKYAPFDWSSPHAHSAYWAYRGLKVADPKTSSYKRCAMMLEQSFRKLVETEE